MVVVKNLLMFCCMTDDYKYKINPFKSTLSLPFIDDFSYDSHQVDNDLWMESSVFVNRTYPINPPTIGVATFDGLDANGIVAECPPGMALAPVYEGEGSEEICTEGGMPLNSQEYFLIQNFGVDWRQNPAFSNLEPDEFPPILQ